MVLIHLNLTDAQADSFCPRCVCKYQTRSLAIIKVVVILVVWVVLLLLFYMAFLSLLEPILNKKRCAGLPGLDRNISYREHHDADTDGKKIKILNMYLQMVGIFRVSSSKRELGIEVAIGILGKGSFTNYVYKTR